MLRVVEKLLYDRTSKVWMGFGRGDMLRIPSQIVCEVVMQVNSDPLKSCVRP